MNTSTGAPNPAGSVDYDLHGLVGIRLIDATGADTAAVTRQIGPFQAPLGRDPDLVVRFVDRVPGDAPVHYLGGDAVGYTEDAFLLLRGKHGERVCAQIPFEQIGERCEIVCETGLAAVPLLVPILNQVMLARGVLPLHASAFSYNGCGVLTTGWSHGGKTGVLLAFMAQGAQFIGDDWIYVAGDGERIYGLPEPVTVRDRYLRELPQYRALVGRGEQARLGAARILDQWMRRAGRGDGVGTPLAGKAVRRLAQAVENRLSVQMRPETLFGRDACPLAGRLDRVFLALSWESPEIRVQPIDPQEMAPRLVFSLQHERLELLSHYLRFRFAFPERRNDRIEQAEECQRRLLARALASKETYLLAHPCSPSPAALFAAIQPLLGPAPDRRRETHPGEPVMAAAVQEG